MRPHTLQFFKKSIEDLTLGTAVWKETIPVPESWWKDYQRPFHTACTLQNSSVHVFEVNRSATEVDESGIRWMGTSGFGFVWTYQREDRWYYTRVFGLAGRNDGAESAVRQRAQEGRPWRVK